MEKDSHSEKKKYQVKDANWALILGLCFLLPLPLMGLYGLSYLYRNPFKDNNAVGATANSLETIELFIFILLILCLVIASLMCYIFNKLEQIKNIELHKLKLEEKSDLD